MIAVRKNGWELVSTTIHWIVWWYVVENSISQIGNINLFTHPRHQQQAEAKELERRFDTNLVIGLRCTTHHRTTRT